MAISLDGTNGITTPDVDSTTSVTTPLVTNAGTLALSATGANIVTASTNGTERMRLDASGNLFVGTTDTNPSNDSETTGAMVFNQSFGGLLIVRRSSNECLSLNRTTTDGDIAVFRKDGTTVGSIGAFTSGTSALFFGSLDTALLANSGNDSIHPWNASTNTNRDNAIDLGNAANRFDDIFATNGTIQTSDRNEKQDIAELDEAERRVAIAAKGLMRKFRWKDAVEEKGDDARIHFGIIAQDLQAAFEAEGLDAGRYAMFISSTWWEADAVIPAVDEVLDDEGNVVTEAQPERTVTNTYQTAEEAPEGAVERTRMGIRYPQLLAFIIGAL